MVIKCISSKSVWMTIKNETIVFNKRIGSLTNLALVSRLVSIAFQWMGGSTVGRYLNSFISYFISVDIPV